MNSFVNKPEREPLSRAAILEFVKNHWLLVTVILTLCVMIGSALLRYYKQARFQAQVEELLDSEPVLSFQSDIRLNSDRSVDVTEHISIQGQGKRVKHGIRRGFLKSITDSNKRKLALSYDLRFSSINGERFKPEAPKDQKERLMYSFGSLKKPLAPGVYNYNIQYTVTGLLPQSGDRDHLELEIIGPWVAVINSAVAVIHMPPLLRPDSIVVQPRIIKPALEGNDVADTESVAFEIEKDPEFPPEEERHRIKIWPTRRLEAGERLLVSVVWPKGFLD